MFGSSPRVRGTGDRKTPPSLRHRFIPACAGNRPAAAARSARRSVHPRVCGEQPSMVAAQSGITGSSPRVRGTVVQMGFQAVVGRFIPACAGNSSSVLRMHEAMPVHPRVCGEQSWAEALVRSRSGSSPRVRGTDQPGDPVPLLHRFIPACAGNSLDSIWLKSLAFRASKISTGTLGIVALRGIRPSQRPSFRTGREADKLQAIEIPRHSTIRSNRVEIKSLVGRCCPAHYSVAVTDTGLDLFPDPPPNSR